MPDSTALDLVTAAAKDLQFIAEGETLSTAAAQDGLDAMNRIVDQLKAEKLAIYTITRTTWTLVSGTQNYTVGSGGTVNVARPVYLERVGYIETATDPDAELPLVKFEEDGWRGVVQKDLTGEQPTNWYYNPTYPLGALSLWPVPTSSTLLGVLYAPAAVSEFASLATAVSLPPGYREMLVTALAVRLGRPFGRPVTADMVLAASGALMVVKRANFRPQDLSFDAMVSGGGGYNIVTDQ